MQIICGSINSTYKLGVTSLWTYAAVSDVEEWKLYVAAALPTVTVQ
jgi:hypothetical protein